MTHERDSDDDLPQVPLFDREHQRRGRAMNMMAMSLNRKVNRVLFKRDELAYLERYGLSEEQKRAVVNRDWREMVRLGGNLFCILKITAVDPYPITKIGADQRGMDHDDFLRNILGKRLPAPGSEKAADQEMGA